MIDSTRKPGNVADDSALPCLLCGAAGPHHLIGFSVPTNPRDQAALGGNSTTGIGIGYVLCDECCSRPDALHDAEAAVQGATHGYLNDLHHVAVSPELPFLYHPDRFVRAVEDAVGAGGSGAKLYAAVEQRWRQLAEAGDAPFLWHAGLVRTVAAAVHRGELQSDEEAGG